LNFQEKMPPTKGGARSSEKVVTGWLRRKNQLWIIICKPHIKVNKLAGKHFPDVKHFHPLISPYK